MFSPPQEKPETPLITSICPIFPSQNIPVTTEFYSPLGFEKIAEYEEEGHFILKRDSVELHFFGSDTTDPYSSNHAAFIQVDDANELSKEFAKLDISKEGNPRVTLADNKLRGICELAIVDPDGNLLRVGHIL